MQYLTEGVLPQRHSERYKLKRLATRYFLYNTVLFKKGYDGDPLRCLGPEEAKEMIKEVHSRECGEHQGKKKLYKCLLQMGYYWPTMKKDAVEFVKKCHSCQVQANLIHTHPQCLHSMVTPWPFHTWGLDLVRPVNPPSRGVHMDIGSYRIFYQVGGGSATPQGYRRSSGKLHQRKYNCEVWGAPQDHQRQWHTVCQQ